MQGQAILNNKDRQSDLSSLALCSSGMDSVYNLLLAKKNFVKTTVLFLDYGHKASPQEYIHVKKISKILGLNFIKADLPWYSGLNSSLLSKGLDLTKYTLESELKKEGQPPEWVPNRNSVFLNIAAAYAESMSVDRIIIGVNKEEALKYPDNSADFLVKVNQLLELSTMTKPKVLSYSSDMTKKQILLALLELAQTMNIENIQEYIWSCYDSYEKMCGRCESCFRLKLALSQLKQRSEWEGRFLN